jgi:predicted MPP superfamily phosphohydrolase
MSKSGPLGLLIGMLALLVLCGTSLLLYRWAVRRFRVFARHRVVLASVMAMTVALGPIGRLLANVGSDRFSWVEAIANLWGLSLLVAVPVIYALDFLFTRKREVEPTGDEINRREALARVGGSIALGASMVPIARGVATRFDYDVVELPIRLPKLPRSLDGFTIAQISDIHVGVFLGERELRWAEDSITNLRPDLVVMTGDLVHLRPSYLPLACDWLRRLGSRARHGSLSIMGNHEYYVGRAAVLEAFAAAKLELLLNESRMIAGGIGIAGVDDIWSDRVGFGPRLDRALASVSPDAPRILLAHQPQYHDVSAPLVDLQLSGHTHGGQIAPFGPVVASALTKGRNAGLYRQGASSLYVNRGFGTSGPPSRVAVRPEITKIVLVSG